MTNLLHKLKLIQDLKFKLNISKTEFTKKFRENVDESNLGYEPFEVFQSSTNHYKGNIYNNNFELKKRKRFFDTRYSFAKVTGQLVEENEHLNIEVEINAFKKRMIIFFGFLILFYLVFIIVSIFGGEVSSTPLFFLPFLMIHMCVMLGIPYFMIRRSVSKMAYDLERDFHYWVTKN
ncbi:MAG: hypothetical protein EOO44_00575 [Flavobacterium sp.]|nr:MAG: hypothetical protein EOO44_00575 [Flavobacterium sp.]